MRVVQVARAPWPIPTARKASDGIPVGKVLPWCRSTSTATGSGRFPIAKFEVAGPLPVLAGSEIPAFTNPDVANPFPNHAAEKVGPM
jgi:hypothetical protein